MTVVTLMKEKLSLGLAYSLRGLVIVVMMRSMAACRHTWCCPVLGQAMQNSEIYVLSLPALFRHTSPNQGNKPLLSGLIHLELRRLYISLFQTFRRGLIHNSENKNGNLVSCIVNNRSIFKMLLQIEGTAWSPTFTNI